MNFNMKSNEVISDFKLLPCYIKSKLFVRMLTDVSYGILNHEKCLIFMTHGEKVVRKLWRLPYITHCNPLHTINNSLPIQI